MFIYYRYINYIISISKYIIYIFIKINKSKYKIYKSKYIKGHRSRQISKFETSQGYTVRLCCGVWRGGELGVYPQ